MDSIRSLVSRWSRCPLLIFFVAVVVPSAARCEYLLQPGDVIAISTIGSDDLKQTSTIRQDGDVALPLIGEVKAAGLSMAQLRARVISILATKVLRRRTLDGREFPVVISADQLVLKIAQYTPVYVTGDVAKPGEQTFRPGLTVRQAIALAGGYDVMQFRMGNPFLQSADLRAQYETLWTEFAQNQADALRIKTELANGTKLDRQSIRNLPIAPPVSEGILDVENKLLASRANDKEKEIASLKNGIAQEEKRIQTLSELEKKEHEGSQADQAEYERVAQLFKTGAVPITRVSEMRRLILISSTRELQTTVQRYGVEREQQVLERELQRFRDKRKIQLLRDLQTTEAQLAKVRALLQATGEKLVYTSMIKSQLTRGKDSSPDLIVHHANGKSQRATQDAALQPGDVVEVRLHVAPLQEPSAQLSSSATGKSGH
jgi:polysaccharide biosynthesis/export protein